MNSIVWICDPKFLALLFTGSLSGTPSTFFSLMAAPLSKWAETPQEHPFLDLVLLPLSAGGAGFPRQRARCRLPRDRRQATACTHLGSDPGPSIWRRRARLRPLPAACLRSPCRRQDCRRPRLRPRPRLRSRPRSRGRAPGAHGLSGPRPAARTRCPSRCFMGRWTPKTRSWPPARMRSGTY